MAVGVVVVVEGLLEALLSILRLAMLHTLVFPNLVFFSRSHSVRYFQEGNQRLNIEDTVCQIRLLCKISFRYCNERRMNESSILKHFVICSHRL